MLHGVNHRFAYSYVYVRMCISILTGLYTPSRYIAVNQNEWSHHITYAFCVTRCYFIRYLHVFWLFLIYERFSRVIAGDLRGMEVIHRIGKLSTYLTYNQLYEVGALINRLSTIYNIETHKRENTIFIYMNQLTCVAGLQAITWHAAKYFHWLDRSSWWRGRGSMSWCHPHLSESHQLHYHLHTPNKKNCTVVQTPLAIFRCIC